MKRTILLTTAILCAAGTRAQEAYDLLIPEPETPVALRPVEGGRIYRTEVIPYDKRHDADARNLAGADAYMAYTPEPFAASGDAVAVGQVVEIPYVWTDGVVYLHLENIGTAYTLPRARLSRTVTFTRRPNVRSAISRSRSCPTRHANSACWSWRSSRRTVSTTTNP